MRIILQDTRNGWYYQGQGDWTPDRAVAFDFQFSAGLPDFSEKLELRDARLLVDRDDAPFSPEFLASSSPQP